MQVGPWSLSPLAMSVACSAVARVGFVESSISGLAFAAMRVARRMGHRVIFFTRDLGYYRAAGEASELAAQADEVVVHETNDEESLLAAVAAVDGGLDALVSIGDFYVVQAAQVARRLGLPALDVEAAITARSKLLTRMRCREAGLPTPAFRCADTPEAAVEAARAIAYPCVVKPVDGTASMQVVRCESDAQVLDAARSIWGQRTNGRGQARARTILVEEYLLGPEVSVETLTSGGATHVVGVTDKRLAGAPYFVEVGHVFPSGLPGALESACADVAIGGLKAIGFDLGVAHTELKITETGPSLIEINARPAGDQITDLVEQARGIDLLGTLVQSYLGDRSCPQPRREWAAAIRFFAAGPGRVTGVWGEDLAARAPGVVEMALQARPRQVLGPLRSSKDRLGHVMTVASTPYLAERLAEAAWSQVEIATEAVA